MAENLKQSFILYKNYYEILDDLQDTEMGTLFRAILKYQATGELPELPLNLKIVFNFIKNQFDMDEKKYNDFLEKQSENGKKGGRPKTDNQTQENPKNPPLFSETEKNPKNPTVFLKTQKSLNENENVNENVNVNENENVSLSDEREGVIGGERGENIQEDFSEERGEVLTEEEKSLLENYVRGKKLATKNVHAYVNKIIENGDHRKILEEIRSAPAKKTREEIIADEIASVHDKRSAAKVLYRYHETGGSPPDEFEDIMKQYDFDTYDKLYAYSLELMQARSP